MAQSKKKSVLPEVKKDVSVKSEIDPNLLIGKLIKETSKIAGVNTFLCVEYRGYHFPHNHYLLYDFKTKKKCMFQIKSDKIKELIFKGKNRDLFGTIYEIINEEENHKTMSLK